MSSDFWLNKFTGRPAGTPPPAPQAGLTPTGAPWWANPAYTSPQQPAQPQQAAQSPYSTDRAQSARHTERCPSCDSDHYWRPSPNVRATCFDCGWPTQNSTQGVAISNRDAPARHSLHQAKGAGYRPDVIVGRM